MIEFLKNKLKKATRKKIMLWIAGIATSSTPFTIALITAVPIVLICMLLFLGGSNEGYEQEQSSSMGTIDGVALPEGCTKHSDRIKKELKSQGVDESHLNVMLAICAQESGGSVSDIFQASESKGLPPNTIGPTESIKAGVSAYKEVLNKSKAKKIGDDNWKAALQSYNFGGGFLDFFFEKGSKFSEDIAQQFSKKMAKETGWTSYGDPKYVEHVMRYLSQASGGTLDGNAIGSPVDPKLLNRVTCKIGGYPGHPGIDIALPEGTPIYAITDGKVVEAVNGYTVGGLSSSLLGKDNHVTVISKDNPTLYMNYRHLKLNGVLVKKGDTVKAGQQVGLSGNTGYTSGPHLHLDALKNNQYTISAAVDWFSPLEKKFNVKGSLGCGL